MKAAFKEDQIADYEFAGKPEENFFYANGRWASTAEYFEAAEDGEHSLRLKYEASAVNLVMASPRGASAEVILLQDRKPLKRSQATKDTLFRSASIDRSADCDESYLTVGSARMYFLVDNHEFGEHKLELICSQGIAVFAFTFIGCVDPVASALQATVSVS